MSGAAPARTLARSLGYAVSLAALGGCASLSGNIKGSFTCAAPDGICAPSAVIDDRALAMITDDPSASATPADLHEGRRRAVPAVVASKLTSVPLMTSTSRTRERVMRIVFPSFIDERGRLHEASAVHAVVAEGEWQNAIGTSDPSPARNALAAAPQMQSLAEAADQAEPPLPVDPNLPTPAAVEVARALKPDPVTDIKADVARRLSSSKPRPRAASPSRSGGKAAATQPAVAPGPDSAPVGASGEAPDPAANRRTLPPGRAIKPTTAKEAAMNARSDSPLGAAVSRVVPVARSTPVSVSIPDGKPARKETVQAAGFPGGIPEDD